MIENVGIDILEVSRIKKFIQNFSKQLNRIFTETELENSKKVQIRMLAEIFAAKEAVLKVLGTGWQRGICWTDVEILTQNGLGQARLAGAAKQIAEGLNMESILVSTSSTKNKAVAQAIGIKKYALVFN